MLVLDYTIDFEYDGFVFEYGSALLISYGDINTGIAIGPMPYWINIIKIGSIKTNHGLELL